MVRQIFPVEKISYPYSFSRIFPNVDFPLPKFPVNVICIFSSLPFFSSDLFQISLSIEIILTKSKFYSNFTYKGRANGNVVDGHIIKGESPIKKWNIYVIILVILLSEILIFPYAGGALWFHLSNYKLIVNLDEEMKKLGYEKIEIDEEL